MRHDLADHARRVRSAVHLLNEALELAEADGCAVRLREVEALRRAAGGGRERGQDGRRGEA